MKIHCPACGSHRVRHSKNLSVAERIIGLLGRHTLRCKECHHRFQAKVWRLADLRWARCPKCYRKDLSFWSEEHYLPTRWTRLLLNFGAKRLRCEVCRFNFAGFRPIKERYQFPRARRAQDQTFVKQAAVE
jgi:Zn finger protein HypA/HybF involved in hydrogenase expression